jgi:hypothetical protein
MSYGGIRKKTKSRKKTIKNKKNILPLQNRRESEL